MPELPASASTASPEARALTALDVPLGKGVVVIVCVDVASVLPQVSIAAVVFLTAPGARGQEAGQAGTTAAPGVETQCPPPRKSQGLQAAVGMITRADTY